MPYATLEDFKTWIGHSDTTDDAHLEPILAAAKRYIDRRCGRHFDRLTAVTQLLYPSDADSLQVTDLISVTSIDVDSHGDRTFSTVLATTDYELLPYVDAMGSPAVRFQEVRLWPTSSKSFTPGYLVRIVGDFGYVDAGDTTPDDIRLANLILAGRYWKRHETPLGILGMTDLGTFERISKEDPDVTAILEQYARGLYWVVV
jgi:Phage gp6-like head-tail connector protein